MNTRLFVTGCVAVMSAALVTGQSAETARPAKPATDVATQRTLVDQYCVVCHNAKLKTAGLLLDELELAHFGDHAEIGEKVVRKLRAGLMPPPGMRRPDAATMESLIGWMEN